MREHPIPQDVTGYKFHIIGSMTLKQFAEFGVGVFLAILFYNSNLFFFIKWPLLILSLGGGFLVAFVPVAERPLDHWLFTFFRILYKPTKFFWKRVPRVPDAFSFKPSNNQAPTEDEIDLSPARKQRVREFFTSISHTKPAETWEINEANKVNQIIESFKTVKVDQTNVIPQKLKPNLGVRVRKLKSPPASSNLSPQETVIFSQTTPRNGQDRKSLAGVATTTEQVANQIEIPELQTIQVQKTHELEQEQEQNMVNPISDKKTSFLQHKSPQTQNSVQPTGKVVKNASLPFPTKPSKPNKIVGMVLTPENKLIEGAIVQIKNLQGNIVRAVKTNPLGQFFITTSLGNGQYIIDVEKDDLNFQPLQLELVGDVVDPIEITNS